MPPAQSASSCPSCRGPVRPRAENVAFPFCCPRCRTIDLGEWLTESYRIPIEADDTERDGPNEVEVRGRSGDEPPN